MKLTMTISSEELQPHELAVVRLRLEKIFEKNVSKITNIIPRRRRKQLTEPLQIVVRTTEPEIHNIFINEIVVGEE